MYADIFLIKPWHSLTEIPENNNPVNKPENKPYEKPANTNASNLSADAQKLLWDIFCYLFSSITARIKRLNISARAYEQAKLELCHKKLIIESIAGKILYLIPLKSTYEAYQKEYPFQGKGGIEHQFYQALHAIMLKHNPHYKNIIQEYRINTNGASADMGILCNDGTYEAYEIILTTSNILSNAQKYENTAFIKIYFSCKTYQLKQAVKASLKNSGIHTKLLSRIECVQFSGLLTQYRNLYNY